MIGHRRSISLSQAAHITPRRGVFSELLIIAFIRLNTPSPAGTAAEINAAAKVEDHE
jgi:hypothetical protein